MKHIVFFGLLLLCWACTPAPVPIEYGSDACTFCQMTIVDQQHGAEVVTSKGKAFKFDAIECMVHYITQSPETYAFYLVNDYENPGKLLDAQACTFLISEGIPSPMGASLSGFAQKAAASTMQAAHGGTLYSWKQIIELRTERGTLIPTE